MLCLTTKPVFSVPGFNLAGSLKEVNSDHAFKEFISSKGLKALRRSGGVVLTLQ